MPTRHPSFLFAELQWLGASAWSAVVGRADTDSIIAVDPDVLDAGVEGLAYERAPTALI